MRDHARPLRDLVATTVGGGTPARDVAAYWGGDIPWASVKDLHEDSLFLSETEESITSRGLASSSASVVNPGSVVVAMRMAVGRAALVQRPVAINQDLRGLVPRQGGSRSYLLHVLRHIHPRLEAKAIGTTVRGVAVGDLLREVVFAPPGGEQRAIALILDTLDQAVEGSQVLIAKLGGIREGLSVDLLNRGVDKDGQLRDPALEGFAESPWGLMPSCWELSTVGREFDITPGITLGPHRRPRAHSHPYLRVANVYRNLLKLDDVAHLEVTRQDLEERVLREGDILLVEGHADVNQIGRCAKATSEVVGFTYQNHLFRLRPRRLEPSFSVLWMNSEFARAHWRQHASTSSGLNTLNQRSVRRLPVIVPPADEQSRIVDQINAVDERLDDEQRALRKLRLLRDDVRVNLLEGRIDVGSQVTVEA